MKYDNLKFFAPNKSLSDNDGRRDIWDLIEENRNMHNYLPQNHYSNNNTYPENMRGYEQITQTNNMNNYYYQDGGQMAPQQGAPDENQIVEAIMQAFEQLSPQGQQVVIQGLSEMMQGGGGGQQAAPPEEQYVPPQQRMGGYSKNRMW